MESARQLVTRPSSPAARVLDAMLDGRMLYLLSPHCYKNIGRYCCARSGLADTDSAREKWIVC